MASTPQDDAKLAIADSTDYFYTPSLKGLVQQIVHLAFFGDGLSVVLGSRGSGKTLLAKELETHLSKADNIASITIPDSLELFEGVALLVERLGLARNESTSIGEMLAQLRSYSQALIQDKKLVILLIDDAHFLDDQAIGAMISLLQGRSDANFGLGLVFLGEPGLEKRIDALQILDVAVYDFDIPNFSPSELVSFLNAKGISSAQLDAASSQKLWANSHGIPGSALDLLSESGIGTNEYKTGSIEQSRSRIPIGHIAAIAVLGLVLIWSLMLRGGDPDEYAKDQVAASEDGKQSDKAKVDNAPIDNIQATHVLDAHLRANEANQDTATNGAVTNKEGPAEGQLDSPKNTIDELSSNEISTVEDKISADDTALLDNGESVGEETVEESNDKTETSTVTFSAGDVGTSQPERPDFKSLEASKAKIALEQKPLLPQQSALKEMTVAESFLMSQDPNAYTLQVIAASRKPSLEAYIKRQPNVASLYMYRGTREEKSWFVVVQGVYKTRSLALKAIASLPKEQSSAGPWPRRLSSIQEEIETFRRK